MMDHENDKLLRVDIRYTNHRGETANRVIVPDMFSLRFEAIWWHLQRQWIIDAFDIEKGAMQTFALKDIHSWVPSRTDEEAKRLDISVRNGVKVQDRHRILDRFPAVLECLHSWIDDPAPKLRGLFVRVTTDGSMRLQFEMSVERDGRVLTLARTMMMHHLDVSTSPFREWKEWVTGEIEAIHFGLIDGMRKSILAEAGDGEVSGGR